MTGNYQMILANIYRNNNNNNNKSSSSSSSNNNSNNKSRNNNSIKIINRIQMIIMINFLLKK